MSEEQTTAYRNQLLEAEQKIGEGYDKTLITLSGGSLAISITFIKELVGDQPYVLVTALAISWSSWAISLTSLLLAFYFGGCAYRHTIKTLDNNTLNRENPGGFYTTILRYFIAVGGISFIVGVVTFLYFAFKNIGA